MELKVPWLKSVIFKVYNCAHNIFELVDILPNVSFTTSETDCD